MCWRSTEKPSGIPCALRCIGKIAGVKRRRWRRFLAIFATGFVASLVSLWLINLTLLNSAEGRIFLNAETTPVRRVALVLGTSPRAQGQKNLYFERRMNAAARLYRLGRVDKLLVSGDNSTPYYDEPTAMKAALEQRGIPPSSIVLDYAGFRTLDSVIRAHRVFGVTECTIVTDDFHLPRALYIARHEGLDAIGYQTEPLPSSVSPRTHIREIGSRALAWFDIVIIHRKPKFLGAPERV